MCPNTPHRQSKSWSSTSRTLLTRLSSLSQFRPRFRNLADFHIRPDEPHRKYSPGDIVRGAVILTVVKPIRITHLTVCLHGFVRVFKSPNGANEPFVDPGLTIPQDARKSQYFGNGHASLFQDEITLCGEGRLDTGIYEFNFELMFPSKGLPTSIDFERGTISYLITSTITRPTSINPTKSCDRKVSLVETVDIGSILPPKPRTISLTPVARRTKRKRSNRREKENEYPDDMERKSESPSQAKRSPRPDDSASVRNSIDGRTGPKSLDGSCENRSTMSFDNSISNKERSSTEVNFRATIPSISTFISESQYGKGSAKDRRITATIELLKSGCLPGDNLPLKVTIKHTKAIRSMNGVIITLYRQGRIDSAPPLSQFAPIEEKEAAKLKHEEYYPKSKTGLKGLSLTSAGSSSIFRKDLAQTLAPIVVDPTTLTAVIQASVRVPEYVFPTICGVPGQMITFKYNIEVVVDLGGKLTGQQRHTPLLRAVTLPLSSTYVNSVGTRQADTNTNVLSSWVESIIGTESIRREKSVVACSFEVVVGSKDSVRSRKASNSSANSPLNDQLKELITLNPLSKVDPTYKEFPCILWKEPQQRQLGGSQSHSYEESESGYLDYYPPEGNNPQHYLDHFLPPSHQSIPVPPSEIQSGEALSEKEQARLAEERLLPSRPPIDPSGSFSVAMSPMVPSTEDENDIYSADEVIRLAALANLAPVTETEPKEDKLEIERRWLLTVVSAPSRRVEDDEDLLQDASVPLVPTTPVVVEGDEYREHGSSNYFPVSSIHAGTRELLPRYER